MIESFDPAMRGVPIVGSAAGIPRSSAIAVVHVTSWADATIEARSPSAAGGAAQLAALDAAIDSVVLGHARALVTGPISKAAVALAGASFVGHTEHLAVRAGLMPDAVTMSFLGPRLRTALVTTHLPVRAVPGAITIDRIVRTAVHLAEACLRLVDARPPRIAVAGVNPHAGEGGLFGDEEDRVVRPALLRLAGLAPFAGGRAELVGLVPAETAFRWAAGGVVDGVVAMSHDQATIASKLLDFTEAVNTTWGLPFVRTSVDHGVAYDAARRGHVDASGMSAAIALATRLSAGLRA
jgi:4-hydroxythreonine-4-phosphate dehydrogenase